MAAAPGAGARENALSGASDGVAAISFRRHLGDVWRIFDIGIHGRDWLRMHRCRDVISETSEP